MCKKQGAISHSSSEAEVIALEACVRMEGLPSLLMLETMKETLDFKKAAGREPMQSIHKQTKQFDNEDWTNPMYLWEKLVHDIDYVPCTISLSKGKAKLIMLEDNEAVLKILLSIDISSNNKQSNF